MEKETYPLSEYMKLFFNKLLDLKQFVKEKYEETGNEDLLEIYNKLNEFIAEEE